MKNIKSYLLAAFLLAAVATPVHAAPLMTSSVIDQMLYSYAYPSRTISGLSSQIPSNAVITEIGYGSDEDNWFMGGSQGEFYEKEGAGSGIWGVRVLGGKTSWRGTIREGVFMRLNDPPQTDSYMTQWAWASSKTSGGHPGVDNFPVHVCVHAKYRLFDPVTHELYGDPIESGNCSANQYQPGWMRGVITADPGKFLVNIWQFQFGHDANLAGGLMNIRKMVSGSYDAQGKEPLPLHDPMIPGRSYPAVLNMKNTGSILWPSEREVNRSHECDDWEPGGEEETCTFTRTVTSDLIKLRRVDTGASKDAIALSLASAPQTEVSDFGYARVLSVTRHSRAVLEQCIGTGGIDIQPILTNKGFWSRLVGFFVPEASALIPVPGPDDCVPPVTNTYETQTETPVAHVVTNASGGFGFLATASGGPASYDLKFQMVKTDTNQLFGDVVTVPVTVGTAGTGVGLSCQTVEQIVAPGEVASYNTVISSNGGFSGNVTISVASSSLPAGASSPGASVAITASSTVTALVPVVTTATTPQATSELKFQASAPGIPTQECTSLLTVRDLNAATLTLSPATQSVQVGSTASFAAWYDPDGAAGPEARQNVTVPAAWMSQDTGIATAQSPGVFRGESVDSVVVRATYGGLTALGTLNVVEEAELATLTITPANGQVAVGDTVRYTASYDSDGPGGNPPQDVSGDASWEAGETDVATSQGNGTFRGNALGSSGVIASYGNLAAGAMLNVVSPQASCSFGATPGSLFIPPRRSTTISWSCAVPTTCTVTKVTGGSSVIASGGQSGSGQDSPQYTTDYHLSCANGVEQDLRVRVFDVTTRVEILPR